MGLQGFHDKPPAWVGAIRSGALIMVDGWRFDNANCRLVQARAASALCPTVDGLRARESSARLRI